MLTRAGWSANVVYESCRVYPQRNTERMHMRVNFEANAKIHNLIEELQARTDVSKKRVIEEALVFLKWRIAQEDSGMTVVGRSEDGARINGFYSALTL